MDEVKAMARAGENVGKAVGLGMKTARHKASMAGKAGLVMSKEAVARAERELAERGIATDELPDKLARKTTGMSKKKLAKKGRKTRGNLARNARVARRELATAIEPPRRSGRRKWVWGLLMLAAMGAVAAVVLSRRPEELPVGEAEDTEFPTHRDNAHTMSSNGSAPQHSGQPSPLRSDAEK